jgi:dATP pyrophosphohydrolase
MRQPHEALVFLHRQGAGRREVLVLHRVPDDYWHGLAGGLEDEETAAEAALREVAEEAGLDVRETLFATGHGYVYELPVDPVLTTHFPAGTAIEITCFEAEVPPGTEPVLNDEHDTYRWCSFAEADALLRWEDTREALRLLGERLGAGA